MSKEETEMITEVINKFIIFLQENDIENEYLIDVIENDMVTRQIIYTFHELLTLNFSIFDISEVSEILPKEIKGGTIKESITFLLIFLLLSNIFAGVESILFKKASFKLPVFAKHSMDTLSSKIFSTPTRTSPTRTSPTRTSPTRTSPTRTSPRIRKRDIVFEKISTITFEGLVDRLNDKMKEGKDNKVDKFGKAIVSSIKLSKDINFENIKDTLFSSTESFSSLVLKKTKQDLLDKISLIIKMIDTTISSVLFGMKITSTGLTSVYFVEYAFSFAKICTSIAQIQQKLCKKGNTKVKYWLDIVSNVFIFRDIGKIIEQLSLIYLGYIGLMIISYATTKRGGRTHRKRKSKRKTKKINLRKKLKYSVHQK